MSSDSAYPDGVPLHVVPASDKWNARMALPSALAEALEGLDTKLPEVDDDCQRRLGEARGTLVEAVRGKMG